MNIYKHRFFFALIILILAFGSVYFMEFNISNNLKDIEKYASTYISKKDLKFISDIDLRTKKFALLNKDLNLYLAEFTRGFNGKYKITKVSMWNEQKIRLISTREDNSQYFLVMGSNKDNLYSNIALGNEVKYAKKSINNDKYFLELFNKNDIEQEVPNILLLDNDFKIVYSEMHGIQDIVTYSKEDIYVFFYYLIFALGIFLIVTCTKRIFIKKS